MFRRVRRAPASAAPGPPAPAGTAPGSTPVVLLRRALLGYRRDDVDEALAAQQRRIEVLASSVESLWREKERAWHAGYAISRSALSERERHEARLREERERATEAEDGARSAAARIVAEAEERAARLTAEAADQLLEVTKKMRELVELRDSLLEEVSSRVPSREDGEAPRPARRRRAPAAAKQLDEALAETAAARPGS